MQKPLWIIVPAFDEAARLDACLQSLCSHYANVVVVDDGSTDDTARTAAQHPVHLLRHLTNLGQGAALRTGLDYALARGAEVLVTFDADGQHRAEDVEAVAAPVRSGEVDVALGSRFLGQAVGMPASRRMLLKIGILLTRLFSRLRVTDTHNGLRAFSRDAARRIPILEDGMAHASEILDEIYLQGLRFCEVPVQVQYSRQTLEKGQSNWSALRIAGQFLMGRIFR